MADDGFQFVKSKKRRKRNRKGKYNTLQSTNDSDTNSDYCDVDRIIRQLATYREEIQASSFYAELKIVFKQPANGQNKDTNDEESMLEVEHATINMENHDDHCCTILLQHIICYGIGCIRTCPNARYQFALLILLKELLKVSSQNCLIYEPLFNEHDQAIVKHFGFSLIEKNEQAKRTVLQPTLLYMIHCSKLLYNNLLWANWGPSLKNVVVFGNTFSCYKERLPSRHLNQVAYLAKIVPYTIQVDVPNSFHLKDIFNNCSLHCFSQSTLEKLSEDFWEPRPEPVYDINDPEIVT